MLIRRIIALGILVLLVAGAVTLAVVRNHDTKPPTSTLRVAASFYPLYEFAKDIGGDKVTVSDITPAGAEPHDYEPSPKVLVDAQQAAVFIYNGGTMEPWVANFLHDYRHVAIKSSQGIPLQAATDESNTSAQVQDPHFWLDPVLAQTVVNNIRDGLSKADPGDRAFFAKNAANYNAKLQQLDHDFQAGLASCQTRTLVTSHAAFGYLAKRYNLDVHAIAGITPDEEPSAAKLAELTQLVRDQNIHYIFFESLVSPKLADTIAQETGAKPILFDPIEGLSDAAQQQGQNYLSIQEQNLANLRTALACR